MAPLRTLWRFLRLFFLISIGAWGVSLLTIHLILSTEKGQRWVRRAVVSLLQESLETDIELQRIRLSGLAHLSLEGVVLYDKACQPFVRLKEARVSWTPAAFWQGFWKGKLHLPLSQLTLYAPEVYIYREQTTGLTNVDRLFPPDTTPPSSSRLRVSLSHLALEQGSFRWVDSTQADSLLRPMPGFMRYDNLHLDSLFLEAEIDWRSEGRLFANIHSLRAVERHAGLRVLHLGLTIHTYPDSTVIPRLEVRLPSSSLQVRGRFHREGLDSLFSDTETKFFTAHLKGSIDWEEIAAFAGDSLPLRGKWEIDGEIQGDEYHFRTPHLYIRLTEEEYIRLKGQIVHYARPQQMAWRAELEEIVLTPATLSLTLPLIGPIPLLDSAYAWHLSGLHEGRLHEYRTALRGEGFTIEAFIGRDTVWRYSAEALFSGWSLKKPLPRSGLDSLKGSLSLQGEGFSLTTLRGQIEADLHAIHDSLGPVALLLRQAVAEQALSGTLAATTSYGQLWYTGLLPLAPTGSYRGIGSFSQIDASIWGASGQLSGAFSLQGTGFPWEEGRSTVEIDSLWWALPDTVYWLSSLILRSEQGRLYTLEGDGLSIWLQGDSSWIEGVQAWLHQWEGWINQGNWPIEKASEMPWSLTVRLIVESPLWLRLTGLSELPESYGTLLTFQLRSHTEGKEVTAFLGWDSLHMAPLRMGPSQIHLSLREDSLPYLALSAFSPEGKAYLSYRKLRLSAEGPLTEGKLTILSQIGSEQDSLALFLGWKWPGGTAPFALAVEEHSLLSLGGQEWRIPQGSTLAFSPEGEWTLTETRLHSGTAQLYVSKDAERLLLEAEKLPIGDLLAAMGKTLPIEGLLALRWTQKQGNPIFSLRIDSLSYEGNPYPQVWATGEAAGDSVPFRFGLREGEQNLFVGRGSYDLTDSISPLYAELRTLQIPAQWLAPFLGEYIQNPRGSLRSQRLIITGTLDAPTLRGEVFCDNLSFYVPLTRVSYTVEGVVRLRGDTISLPNIDIRDVRGKKASLSGHIALRQWVSPYLAMELRLREAPFLLATAPPTTDAYLYGRAELDQGSLVLVGPWTQPSLRGTLRFAESTDLTLPLQTYERSTSTPHVRFVQTASPSDTATPTLTVAGGVDMRIALRSVPQARFRLLFDERTGDEVLAQGSSNLLLTISPEGSVTLSGSYEIQSGEYRVNLQGIASKKLSLEPGSLIAWDGDLYGGQLNLIATYRTFTSLRMIDTSFGYTLPVEVKVFLRGNLLTPTMSFQIDIPSLSGTPTPLVNLFLQRLATDEAERNRQVFALLVLGSFVPAEQGVGSQQVSSGVSSTLAEFLSAQLAGWVGQTLGSQVGVSFSMEQWNELSAQLRLSVSQRLTIERDGVLIGPGQANAALGNLSARYRLLPQQLTQPTQWQLEVEGFSRQTFVWGAAGATSQGAGLRLRKGFYLPERRRKQKSPP